MGRLTATLWLQHQPAPPADPATGFIAESLLASRLLTTLWRHSGEAGWDGFLLRWLPVLPEAAWFRLLPAEPLDGGPEGAAAAYAATVPRRHRLGQGQFFTPGWLAEQMVDGLNLTLSDHCVEPASGCGVFVAALTRRLLALGAAPEELGRLLTAIEISPLLALCTRVQFYLALPAPVPVPAPVVCGDALSRPLPPGTTVVVGNPPWVPMSTLTPAAHAQAVALFRHHDMAPRGPRARLGEANADLCGLFAVHLVRQLAPDGRAALLLKGDVLYNAAGSLLRKRLTQGDSQLTRVDDLSALRLFDSQSPCILTHWQSGGGATQSVPLFEWDTQGAVHPAPALALTTEAADGFPYEVRHGVKHDKAAVFELRPVRAVPGGIELDCGDVLEPDHIYPLLKSRHQRAWGVLGYGYILVPQQKAGDEGLSPATRTHAYLSKHVATLRARRSIWLQRGPFYSVFGVGPYTWAPYKVTWCRMGRLRGFAVVGDVTDPLLGRRPLLPDHTFLSVPCQSEAEAHYLCACLNSHTVGAWLAQRVPPGKSGLTAGIIRGLKLPRFDPQNPLHGALTAASLAAHAAFPAVPAALQEQVDEAAAQLLRQAPSGR